MQRRGKILCACAVGTLLGATQVASAASVYASVVDSFTPGLRKDLNPVGAPRDNPLNALGNTSQTNADFPDFGSFTAQTGEFVSIGFGGVLVLRFDPFQFGPPAAVIIETTNGDYPLETALVDISKDGVNWVNIGVATNGGTGQTSLPVPVGPWTYLRLTDTSIAASFSDDVADGFDVNAVEVNAVPLPPAVWAGLSLFGAVVGAQTVRRRRSASY